MKRVVLFAVLTAFIFFFSSCSKPEEIVISKYFKAMSYKDINTLAGMAIEPVQLEFKTWKTVSVDPVVKAEYGLPKMLEKFEQLKKDFEAQKDVYRGKRFDLEDLKLQLEEARGKKKTEIQEKVNAAQVQHDEEQKKMEALFKQQNDIKTDIETEKRLITLSTDIAQDLEIYSGEVLSTNITVKVTSKEGNTKEYVFSMKRYQLQNPQTQKPLHSKYIIERITLKE